MFLVRISIKKRAGGRFFVIYYFLLRAFFTHCITFPQGYVGALRSNINMFNFDTHKGLTVKIYIILVCTQQQWALQVTPVGFLLTKTLLIKNNKKKRGGAKK